MTPVARLNVLLTHSRPRERFTYGKTEWPELVSRLLSPVQIQTYVAGTSGEALSLAESHPMHVVVVDFQLPCRSGMPDGAEAMNLVRLLQKLRRHDGAPAVAPKLPAASHGSAGRRIPIADGSNSAANSCEARPLFILLAPPHGEMPQLMQEALRWNVYSVLPEPLNVNELLDTMARALRRFYDNRWPL